MLPTARELLRLAESTGYRVDTLEKVIRLVELLSQMDQHPLLKKCLVLKGGTALNLCFGAPRRLSVDLEFNFIGATDRKEMQENRPLVEQAVEAIGRNQGYAVQKSAESHASRKHYLSYRRVSDGLSDRLEVDINYLHRVCLLPTQRLRIWRGNDEPGPEIALLSWEEIAAGKLSHCSTERPPGTLGTFCACRACHPRPGRRRTYDLSSSPLRAPFRDHSMNTIRRGSRGFGMRM